MSSKGDINADDYYRVLGVERVATEAEIAKAYKKLALKHHPDKNQERKAQAEEEFKRITEAYEVLRCPEKRKEYDQFGKAGCQGGNPQAGEANFTFGARGGPGAANMSREEADRIFSTFFGGRDPFASDLFSGDLFGNGGMGFGGRGFDGFGLQGPSFGGQFPSRGRSAFGRARSRPASASNRRTRSRPQPGGPAPAHLLPNGTAVIVQGLAKVPEHNGVTGRVGGWDPARARYEVHVECGREGTLWLRPRNVTQLCNVEVTGLASKPELNGRMGEVQNYDATKGRYTVRMGDPSVSVSLQVGNCILEAGTRIVVQGLTNPIFNGQMGQIIGVDRAASRYTVECQNGKQIKIRYDNVVC